jgi:hypothetical protein
MRRRRRITGSETARVNARSWSQRHIAPEAHYVAVLDDVVVAFLTGLAGFFRAAFALEKGRGTSAAGVVRVGEALGAEGHGGLWFMAPESVNEIGCIHTCQGLEVYTIGVVVGPDLVVRDGKVVTRPEKRSRQDQSIKGYKAMLATDPKGAKKKTDLIIKNTYRTLMTRGMKGCYVYCTDQETGEYFRGRFSGSREQGGRQRSCLASHGDASEGLGTADRSARLPISVGGGRKLHTCERAWKSESIPAGTRSRAG